MELKSVWKWLDVIALVVVISILLYKQQSLNNSINAFKQEGTYSYCTEWDGWIARENLYLDCFDFRTQSFGCNWRINNTNLNVFIFAENRTDTYYCSKLLKSTNVLNYPPKKTEYNTSNFR